MEMPMYLSVYNKYEILLCSLEYIFCFIWTKYVMNIHNISSLEGKAWIQTFYNKSLFQFITILSNSRQNISLKSMTKIRKNNPKLKKKAFWCTFHPCVVITDHNTVTFIHKIIITPLNIVTDTTWFL
jgi:hypothetical protein